MIDFGLKDLGMGLFLMAVNLTILVLAVALGYRRFLRDAARDAELRAKVLRL